jgi:hypothetical protein
MQTHYYIHQTDFKLNYKNMKTKLLLLLLALTLGVNAQGNLQFNQVLTYTASSPQSTLYTVPSGKVAKITKAIEFFNTSNYFLVFTINGVRTVEGPYGNADGYTRTSKDGMWLKSGDVIGVTANGSGGEKIFLSIIEYNIISP